MSKLLQVNGDDYPEAADKHITDAVALQGCNRHDGAAYLAGYVVECCLKTLLQLETGRILAEHRLKTLGGEVAKLNSVFGAKTAKYASTPALQQLSNSPIQSWGPVIRYRSPGFVAAADSTNWVNDAKAVYHSTIVQMRLDGVI
jgi:hypothetical protein